MSEEVKKIIKDIENGKLPDIPAKNEKPSDNRDSSQSGLKKSTFGLRSLKEELEKKKK